VESGKVGVEVVEVKVAVAVMIKSMRVVQVMRETIE
jgi:hypothetical protein